MHHKNYTDNADEKDRPFEIFKDNLWSILDHNSNSSITYELGLNRFVDLTNEKYGAIFVGGGDMVVSNNDNNNQVLKSDDRVKYATMVADDFPESIDGWDRGVVSPIKDQGRNSSAGECIPWQSADYSSVIF